MRGNWSGTAVVAGITLGVGAVVSSVLMLLTRPPGADAGDSLNLASLILASAFSSGGWYSGDDSAFEFDAGLMAMPLTITIALLALLAWLFRRLIRNYTRPQDAWTDVGRVTLFMAVGLVVPALLSRGAVDEFGGGWAEDLEVGGSAEGSFGAGGVTVFFLGGFLVFLVLACVVLSRRDWWSPRVQAPLDVAMAVVYGHATMLALLPLVGLAGFLLLGFGEASLEEPRDEGYLREVLTLVLMLLANGGVLVLALGGGASVGGEFEADDEPDDRDFSHLWGEVTDDEPGLWASPLLLLATLALVAWVVVRRTSVRERAQVSLLAWVGSLVLVLPLTVLLAGGSIDFEVSGEGFAGAETYEASGSAGAHGVQTTFFLMGIALLVALVVALATRVLDLSALKRAVQGLQTNPGAPPPPPPHPPTASSPPPPPASPSAPPPTGPPPSGS